MGFRLIAERVAGGSARGLRSRRFRLLAGTSPLAPLGARMKEGGLIVSILPHGGHAFEA